MTTLDRLITLPELMDRTGLCRSRAYQLLRDKTLGFPVRVKLSDDPKSRSVRFRESEVNAWIADRIEKSTNKSESK